MKKTILVLLFILVCSISFSQENKIIVAPNSLLRTSSISIFVKYSGTYHLKIKDDKGIEVMNKELEITDKKIVVFKHNFRSFKKGTYCFELFKNNRTIQKNYITKFKE